MIAPLRRIGALAVLLVLGACEAGPSAFARSPEGQGPLDTADAATLPEIPGAPDVEPVADSTVPSVRREGLEGRTAAASVPSGAAREATFASSADTLSPPHFERPEHIRGIYLNAWAAGSRRRIEDLLALAHRTEINTFVIDIKDASGYVSHRTSVPMAQEIGATEERRISDLPGLLRRLRAIG